MKPDGAEDVATVIKGHNTQLLADKRQVHRYRDAELRIDDEQLVSAERHVNRRAIGCRRILAWARRDGVLRPGTVQRKTTERAAAAGEELLTDRHVAIRERL